MKGEDEGEKDQEDKSGLEEEGRCEGEEGGEGRNQRGRGEVDDVGRGGGL